MDPSLLKILLGLAVLVPLASFWVILLAGRWLGKQAWIIATLAIGFAAVLSFISLFGIWLPNHWPTSTHAAGAHDVPHAAEARAAHSASDHHAEKADSHAVKPPPYYAGDYYVLGEFGKLRISIGYHIDALT